MQIQTVNEYYEAYIMNIALFKDRYPIKFIEASKFDFYEYDTIELNWKFPLDPYLQTCSITQLAKDIAEYGTYWFMTCDPQMRVCEGKHRIYALQSLEETKDIKLPCLEYDSQHPIENALGGTLDYYLPIGFIYDVYEHMRLPNVLELKQCENKRLVKLQTDNLAIWIINMIQFTNRINHFISLYPDKQFYGSAYLNDEKLFEELTIDNISNEYLGGFEC